MLPQQLEQIAGNTNSSQATNRCTQYPWEVVVVDNASEDDTVKVALQSWEKNPPTTLRVVHEPRLGLSYARSRGFSEARHEIVSFIDDDNWVSPSWIQLVCEIMSQHPDMGACGGDAEPVCEIAPSLLVRALQKILCDGRPGKRTRRYVTQKGVSLGSGIDHSQNSMATINESRV